MHQPVLETERLVLRPVEPDDQQKIFEGFSNPEVTKFMEITYSTLEAASAQMEWYANNRRNGSGYAWAVVLKSKPGSFIGVLSMYHIDTKHKRAEIGYWTFPGYWHKGYTTEGLAAILDHSVQLGLHRISAEVEPANYGSRRILEKLQFVHEGTFKDYEIGRDGNYLDLEVWARILPAR